MSFDSILDELTRGVPECTASGVVDVPTGTVVSCRATQRGFKHEFELIATAAAAVFAAAPRSQVNGIAGPLAQPNPDVDFTEVTLMGNGQIQVYCRPEGNPDLVLVVVCKSTANIGMVLAKTRLQLTAFAAQVA